MTTTTDIVRQAGWLGAAPKPVEHALDQYTVRHDSGSGHWTFVVKCSCGEYDELTSTTGLTGEAQATLWTDAWNQAYHEHVFPARLDQLAA